MPIDAARVVVGRSGFGEFEDAVFNQTVCGGGRGCGRGNLQQLLVAVLNTGIAQREVIRIGLELDAVIAAEAEREVGNRHTVGIDVENTGDSARGHAWPLDDHGIAMADSAANNGIGRGELRQVNGQIVSTIGEDDREGGGRVGIGRRKCAGQLCNVGDIARDRAAEQRGDARGRRQSRDIPCGIVSGDGVSVGRTCSEACVGVTRRSDTSRNLGG